MKLRKDKTNTAIYEAMMETLKHHYVLGTTDSYDIFHMEPHQKGFYMDFMAVERMLTRFFTTQLNMRIPQIIDEYGEAKGAEIRERLIKLLYCKGIVYRKKKCKHHCHHPLCPICHYHKHLRTIRDLKPYLKADRNRLHLLWEHVGFDYHQIHAAFEALERKAMKVTKKLSPHVAQWSRQSLLRYDEESGKFMPGYVVLAISSKTDAEDMDRLLEQLGKQGVQSKTVTACMANMVPLVKHLLCYDPLVLKHAGNQALIDWEDRTPGFRYWAKVAHR